MAKFLITVTPTIDTAVYAAADRLGSVMTFTAAGSANGGYGRLISAVLTDDAPSAFDIDLAIFQNSPTLVNADNGVYDITDANLATAFPLGWVNFSTGNSYAQGTNNRTVLGTWLGGAPFMPYKCGAADANLYGVFVARGAYDTVGTDDLILTVIVDRD